MFIFVFFISCLFVAVHADCSAETANLPDAPVVTVGGYAVKNATIIPRLLGTALSSNVNITCSVAGGTTPVSQVHITCGTSQQSEGTVTSKVFSISKDFNQPCTCWAEHPSECYNKITLFYFNVQYTPSSTLLVQVKNSLITDGNTYILDSSSSNSAKVTCAYYDGNPAVSEIILECQDLYSLVPTLAQIVKSFQGTFTVKGDQLCHCSARQYNLRKSFAIKFIDRRPIVTVNGEIGTNFNVSTNKAATTVSVSCQSAEDYVAVGCNV